MTKKDFVQIATTIYRFYPDSANGLSEEDRKMIRYQLAHAFADALKQTNVRFDRQRFIAACTGEHD